MSYGEWRKRGKGWCSLERESSNQRLVGFRIPHEIRCGAESGYLGVPVKKVPILWRVGFCGNVKGGSA